jgi:hypothetical protein
MDRITGSEIYNEPNLRPVDDMQPHLILFRKRIWDPTAPLVEESLSPDQTFSVYRGGIPRRRANALVTEEQLREGTVAPKKPEVMILVEKSSKIFLPCPVLSCSFRTLYLIGQVARR